MSWKGIAIGGILGLLFGHSYLGAALGAWMGYQVEREWRYRRRQSRPGRSAGPTGDKTEPPPFSRKSPLDEAYEFLGVSASASDDELRRAYREKAKRCHPDALRAQGLPEELVGRATELMSQLNAAWTEIRKARGI